MTKPMANPPRLSRATDDPVAQLFRAATELPDEDLPRLRWRLRTSLRRRATRPARLLRLGVVVGGVFFLGGVVGAVVVPRWLKQKSIEAPPVSAPTPVIKVTKPRHAAASPATAQPEVAPDLSPVLAPAAPTLVPPKPHVRVVDRVAVTAPKYPAPVVLAPAVAPAPTEPAPVVPSPLAAEQVLLGRSMKALRAEGDPDGALALLAEHARLFPEGALIREASALRVEALLGLNRRGEALAILDGSPLATSPHREEQFVLRAGRHDLWISRRTA